MTTTDGTAGPTRRHRRRLPIFGARSYVDLPLALFLLLALRARVLVDRVLELAALRLPVLLAELLSELVGHAAELYRVWIPSGHTVRLVRRHGFTEIVTGWTPAPGPRGGIVLSRLRRMSAERERVETFGKLENGLREAGDWYHWGPYLSERQWGTVREDYSAGGTAWEYLPHDHARSRAYRWGEDGLAGFSDVEQRLCLGARALERPRPDPQGADLRAHRQPGQPRRGRQGVLVVPRRAAEPRLEPLALPLPAGRRSRTATSSTRTRRRGKLDPEYELLDTGAFDDDRYWIVEVDYAKADPHDLLMTIAVTNAGPEADTLHVLPTAWYRNTWAWDDRRATKPELRARRRRRGSSTEHPVPRARSSSSPDGAPTVLFCENETNARAALRLARRPRRSRRTGSTTTSSAAPTTVAAEAGTKAAFWYQRRRSSRARPSTLRVRLRPDAASAATRGRDFDEVVADAARRGRRVLRRADAGDGLRRRGARAAAGASPGCSGASSSTTTTSRAGSTATRPSRRRPASRLGGRNARWRTFDAFDIMSMPDKWEYPWFAAWDLGVPLRRARARRPGLREVPADPALPRVVPAPERRARRPTSGRSTTSTRRCRRGPRSRCSRSTARATSTS